MLTHIYNPSSSETGAEEYQDFKASLNYTQLGLHEHYLKQKTKLKTV